MNETQPESKSSTQFLSLFFYLKMEIKNNVQLLRGFNEMMHVRAQ